MIFDPLRPVGGSLSAVEPGLTVLAPWGEGLFLGTVVAEAEGGYHVVFEDGDEAVVPLDRMRKAELAVGSRVFARWRDGRHYPGTIARIVGRAFYVHFDDGDRGWAAWSEIAVK
jgi:hypothetical protein